MNRARMSHEKDNNTLRMFLHNLNLRPSNAPEADRYSFPGIWLPDRLDADPASNTLWRLRDSVHTEDCKVVPEDAALDTITTIHSHCQHHTPGRIRPSTLSDKSFIVTITKEEVCIIIIASIFNCTKY